ncbi:MAG: rhomboid family intramembrane serine protease [Bacteroidales bacterium]|nr:rhomboid family intramembrane serine protease [Bacteroidales bacterium]
MGGFNILPTGVKNLLIINVLLFFATVVFQQTGLVDLERWLGLHYFSSQLFQPWQPVTYMFMHANFGHLFFNMFALWMFGAAVENTWGTKRFLLYYFITGVSAGLMHYLVIYFQIHPTIALMNQFLADPSLDSFRTLVTQYHGKYLNTDALQQTLAYLEQSPSILPDVVNNVVSSKEAILNQFNLVGASGAVFALLLAFGMLFPNAEIYIYFLFPIKAKWFVVIYGALELIYGVAGTGDGVAHFAHLSGMLVGLVLILLWKRYDKNRRNDNFYQYYEF